MSKRVRPEDLGYEIEMLAQSIADAASISLELPRMVAAAKSFCPVDTGTLMDSIRVERKDPYVSALVAGGGGYINLRTGREVDYARFVHDGTSRTPAIPFLLQAVMTDRLGLAREMMTRTMEAIV